MGQNMLYRGKHWEVAVVRAQTRRILCRCGLDGELCDECVLAGAPDELLVVALKVVNAEALMQGLVMLASSMVVAVVETDIDVAMAVLDREALMFAAGQEAELDALRRLRDEGVARPRSYLGH
ncbi:hypothetical protein [Streptomyces nymphaeiformis]|uniref:Uncharacterized protein n=1 Tax=Streptomyces nymphaeiformis TaxID=2663842 RepID=A0A7W7XDG0_9ACTN|nr:hypothetical protein [Streptomyces nymphaeiformis]MBB4984155.1 hypothetical protein [Streptomyces nymphaeiformis]